MSVSTVKITGTTVMTVSDTTATAANVSAGREFYAANGTKTQGTFVDENADVLFVDYDGTELYGYSKTEFLALTELPPNPTHSDLTAQGWNWTLSDAKTYVTSYNKLCIGQNYITDDGKTRIYITVDTYPVITLCWRQNKNNGVVINWGDDSDTEVVNSTNNTLTNVSIYHTYENPGDYIITMSPIEGCNFSIGRGGTGTAFFGDMYKSRGITSQVKKIELGNVSVLSSYCLSNCIGIETITMPTSLGNPSAIWASIFQGCLSLKCIVMPSGQTAANLGNGYGTNLKMKYLSLPKSYIKSTYCYLCANLKRIHLQEGCTTIGSSHYESCQTLKYVTIPNTITSIQSYAFYGCCNLFNIQLPSNCTLATGAFSSATHAFTNYTMPEGATELKGALTGVRDLESVTLASTCTSLGTNKSFQNCMKLKFIDLPAGITTLHASDFYQCYSLINIAIRGNITSIPQQCFYQCYSLMFIAIPPTVTSIESQAFTNDYSLMDIYLFSTTPPTLASDALTGSGTITDDGIIYVPYGYGNTYKSASNWSDYASHIVEMPEGITYSDYLSSLQNIQEEN